MVTPEHSARLRMPSRTGVGFVPIEHQLAVLRARPDRWVPVRGRREVDGFRCVIQRVVHRSAPFVARWGHPGGAPLASSVGGSPANYSVAQRPVDLPIQRIIIHVAEGGFASTYQWFRLYSATSWGSIEGCDLPLAAHHIRVL
jgi:hypothetical protein